MANDSSMFHDDRETVLVYLMWLFLTQDVLKCALPTVESTHIINMVFAQNTDTGECLAISLHYHVGTLCTERYTVISLKSTYLLLSVWFVLVASTSACS